MDSPPAEPADARAELLRLLQRYVVEAVRLGRAFAVRHHMHPTDWSALLAVIQGDRVGRPLTPGSSASASASRRGRPPPSWTGWSGPGTSGACATTATGAG